MSGWGNNWGIPSPWGGITGPSPDAFCDLAEQRVLVQMDDTTGNRNFRDYLCAYAEIIGELQDVIFEVGEAFDLETAVGVQLDAIGAVVGLPRQGFTDSRYRTLLRIQIRLVVTSTGTISNILTICRTFIGSTVPDPVVLTNSPPYAFSLSVPGVSLSELDLLLRFICKALIAGVLGLIIIALATNSRYASVHGPVTGSGTYCSVHGSVPGCAKYGTLKTVGPTPC